MTPNLPQMNFDRLFFYPIDLLITIKGVQLHQNHLATFLNWSLHSFYKYSLTSWVVAQSLYPVQHTHIQSEGHCLWGPPRPAPPLRSATVVPPYLPFYFPFFQLPTIHKYYIKFLEVVYKFYSMCHSELHDEISSHSNMSCPGHELSLSSVIPFFILFPLVSHLW